MATRRLLSVFAAAAAPLAAEAEPLDPAFAEQLRCPFAKVWLEYGAERAAEILGVAPHSGRRLSTAWGTCTYTNPFAGSVVCMEFHGSSWDDSTAATRCGNAMPNVAGTLAKGATCQTTANLAGWCMTAGGAERTPMDTSGMAATCAAVQTSCATWSQGTFSFAGKCAQPTAGPTPAPSGSGQPSGQPSGPPSGPPPGVQNGSSWGGGGGGGPSAMRCLLAPGAIGAAHQLAMSQGYDFDCQGTPAERSPYMWPLRWSANVEQKGLPYQTDAVSYESRGKVWYMLDKNWKRLDQWYSKGVQRAVGQGPCDNPVTGVELACNRSSSKNTTVLHRNNKMVFIDYAANGTIEKCSWQDLSIIGNIRPDWFMDDRGDSTDVQYLGDSHVYYMKKPTLVKQWRKKDFANQYFTMSMQRLPGPDGIHWPLILNIPGEGFGDDFLQHWHGHRILNESEAHEFLLDEAYVQSGGSCPQSGGSGSAGPPTGQVAHVPSNLEVDKTAWKSIVFTASPIWSPPASSGMGSSSGLVQDVASGVRVESCFDSAKSTLYMSLTANADTLAWTSVGFRDSEECLMTPRGGGDGEVVFAQPDSAGTFSIYYGPLGAGLKTYQAGALAAFLPGLTPLAQANGFAEGRAEYSNGKLILGFARTYQTAPAAFNLTYAYGHNAVVNHHKSRGCFKVTPVACPAVCSPVGSSGSSCR